MSTRFTVRAAGVAVLVVLAVPAAASASPTSSNGLTVAATPSQILAGQSMLIYGRLKGSNIAGQQVVLYHRIAGKPRFTVIQKTITDSEGFYEFPGPRESSSATDSGT